MIPRVPVLSVLALALTAAAADWGGFPQQRKQKPPPPSPQQVTIDGTIERASPDEIEVTTTRGRRQRPGPTWLVTAQANAKLVVTGTAKADYLKPRMLIQFRAELDDKNRAKEPVSELSIITASRENRPGIFADQGGVRPPADPGVGAGRAKPDAQAEKDLSPLNLPAPKTSRIVGKIATLKDKHVSVQIGGKTVEFDLADDPIINYCLNDPKLVVAGSKVLAKGLGVRGRHNRCQADTVTRNAGRRARGEEETRQTRLGGRQGRCQTGSRQERGRTRRRRQGRRQRPGGRQARGHAGEVRPWWGLDRTYAKSCLRLA